MNRVVTPSSASQPLTALATNSGPLSLLMCSGIPYSRKRSARIMSTSWLLSLRCTTIARHSRVYWIDHGEQLQLPAVVGLLDDEVIGPDVVLVLGSQTDAEAVGQPEAALFRLPLGHLEPLASAPTRGAQEFPRAASCRISLSRVRSETAVRRRAFSRSRSLRRLAWLTLRPPYSLRGALVGDFVDAQGLDDLGDLLALTEQDVGLAEAWR